MTHDCVEHCVLNFFSFIFRDVCTEYSIPYVVTLQVRVVEEAIKYIDELHLALFRRAPILAGESHYTHILCGD